MARRKREDGKKGCTFEGHVPKEGTAVQARQRGRGGSQWGLLSSGEMCIWVRLAGCFLPTKGARVWESGDREGAVRDALFRALREDVAGGTPDRRSSRTKRTALSGCTGAGMARSIVAMNSQLLQL